MSWLNKLKSGLGKSSNKVSSGISEIFTTKRLDDDTLEELEDLLIAADIGAITATKIIDDFAPTKVGKNVTPDEISTLLANAMVPILQPVAQPLQINADNKPHVVLVSGVNGSGKTTSIGKLAKQYTDQGKKVALVAGDTFRAGAIEQLKIWGDRANVPVYSADPGHDAAALVFDAMQQATNDGIDILFIDTAGRLHNKSALMEELQRLFRVIQKFDASAPHDSLLVLDATTGQTALRQVELFQETAKLTGLIVTKLDGTARAGVVVALADQFSLPVHAIGVGEQADDLQPFEADSFARNLVGV